MVDNGKELPLPLEGIRVLACTHVVAGPFCSMLLGMAGAEVIKIERPSTGDRTRNHRPFVEGETGERVGCRYLMNNRNKKSVTLDLRNPKAKSAFEDLVRVSDVVLDNWGPGAMERLGLGYEHLRTINPSIIYTSITGYGDSPQLRGSYSHWAAHNPCIQGMAGWMEITGDPEGRPQMVGTNIGDSVPAVWTAFAILLALEVRRRTGQGQHVDMSMYDCMVAHNLNTFPDYQVTGEVTSRARENMASAQLTVRAKDGYVVLAGAGDEAKWVALWRLIHREDLIEDPRYLGRNIAGPFFLNNILPAVEEWSCTIPKWELNETFLRLGFSSGVVQNIQDIANCPHLKTRQMFTEIDNSVGGKFLVFNSPVKLLGTQFPPPIRPPRLGEHNQEILGGLLRLSPEYLQELKAEGAI